MLKSILCTASAGAGKTYRLTQEVFHRLQYPNRFVVAVTFSRAAAAEMERRLLSEILKGELSPPDPPSKLSLIMRASRVHFSTLDSLFYLFLSTESYVPQIADEHEVTLILRRANERFFHQPNLLEKESLLVMIARILQIEPEDLTKTLKQEADLLLTRPWDEEELNNLRKQQELIKARFSKYQTEVAALAQEYQTEETLKSLHRLVITHLLKPLEELPSGSLFDHADLDEVGTSRGGIPPDQRNSPLYEKLKRLYPEMRRCVADYIINTQKLRAALLWQFAEAYARAIEEEKRSSRRIFFEDIAKRLAHLDGGEEARERPILFARLYELGFHRVTDLFLDEFQDTSRIQLELLRPLLEDILSSENQEAKGTRSIFLVGDWKQSIYQWRNADPEALQNWSETYRQTGQLSVDLLSYNWRSTPLLIGFFNNLVRKLFAGTEREKELQAPPPLDKRKRSYQVPSKVEVIPVPCDRSDDALYQHTLKEIVKLREEGIPYGDITILCRTHTHIKNVTKILAQNGIFTTSIRGRELLSTREGMALYLAIARVFQKDTPKDPKKLEMSHNGSTLPLESNSIGYIERALTFLGFGETLLPLAEKNAEEMRRIPGPHRFASLSRILSSFEPYLPRVVIEAIWSWGEGYFQYEEAKDIHSFLVEWRQNSPLLTVPEPEHSERVRISTIHGVKGLEFSHVILLWKEEPELYPVLSHPSEKFPLSLSKKEKRDFMAKEPVTDARSFAQPYEEASQARKKETANLLYVAATRAVQTLTILVRANKDGSASGSSGLLVEACQAPLDTTIEPQARKTIYGWACQYGPLPPISPVEGKPASELPPTGGESSKAEKPDRTLSDLRIDSLPLPPSPRELDPAYLSERIEAATARGSRIHQVLSAMTPDGRYPTTELIEEDQNTLRQFLSNPEVQKILFRPGAVYTEQHLSDSSEFGIVDRLIVSSDRITLIDYKTGYRTEALLTQYRMQMERYRRMLTTLFPNRLIDSYLLFVDDPKNPIESL
jgi:ATP-dependent exoDNAse (exonuclease V) beta subunit